MMEINKRFIITDEAICDLQTGEILPKKVNLQKHVNRSLNNQLQKIDHLQEKQLFLENVSEEKRKERENAVQIAQRKNKPLPPCEIMKYRKQEELTRLLAHKFFQKSF